MDYFSTAYSEVDVKNVYRDLVKKHHPDRGGCLELMKMINYQYARKINTLKYTPKSLHDVKVGCKVYVNNSPCIVTQVDGTSFKAKSLNSNREAYFSKENGYAMLNFKYRASVKPY